MRLGDIVAWTDHRGKLIVGLVAWYPGLGYVDDYTDAKPPLKPPMIGDPDKHMGIVPVDGQLHMRTEDAVTPAGERDRHGDVLVAVSRAEELRPGLMVRLRDPHVRKTLRARATHVQDRQGNLIRSKLPPEPPSKGIGYLESYEIPEKKPFIVEGSGAWPSKQTWRRIASGGYIPNMDRILDLLGPRQRQVFVRCCLEGMTHRDLIKEIEAAEGIRLSESHISTTRKLAEDRVKELTGLAPQKEGAA